MASTTQMQQASSGFAVIPRLTDDHEVMIAIEPWSDRFLNNGAITGHSTTTSIRARLGEWVEIAGIDSAAQNNGRGFNGLNYSTQDNQLRILIKVDLAD